MRVLIIGSKGFIGSSLKSYLEELNYLVWSADVVTDYTEDERYFNIDATNADFKSIFSYEKFDVCINCSGAASVPDSLKHPHRDYTLNAANVFKILDAIRVYQPTCKYINLSSAAVYGNPEYLPIAENSKISPVSPYGFHKLMSEKICEEFFRFFHIPTCSLRIFSAYGEGLKKQLFWDLFSKTKSDEKILLFGTGLESRDFIYIKDLLRAIHLVVENGDFKGDCINIANGEEVFIKDCVKLFYSLFKKEIHYQFSGEGRLGDPNNWLADIGKLKKIGYTQKFSLQEGLTRYHQWIIDLDKE